MKILTQWLLALISVGACLLAIVLPLTGEDESPPSSHLQPIHVGTFDAEIAENFGPSDGLPTKDIRSIAITADEWVYVGTSRGLARQQNGEWQLSTDYDGPVELLAADGDSIIGVAAGGIYRVDDGEPELLAELPAELQAADEFNSLAVGTTILLGTKSGLYDLTAGEGLQVVEPLNSLLGEDKDIRQVAVAADGRRAVAAGGGLFVSTEGQDWHALSPAQGSQSWAPRDVKGVTFDADDRLWFASPQGIGVQTTDGWQLFTGQEGLPYNDFTLAAPGEEGVVWFGTHKGAIRFDGKTFEYRQAPRWLPAEEVRGIAVNSDGDAWFATPEGVGEIERRPTTLAEKAKFFEDEIDAYHRRTPFGYVLDVHLKNAGDKSEFTQHDSDNDGLWTSMYGAGECFAYGATKNPKAKERATAAFEAVRFLSEVTQGGSHPAPPGFPARTILPTSGPNPNEQHGYTAEGDKERQKDDPQWKVIQPRWPISEDGKWYWKTDTSSDELDGHYFLYALYYDLVAETDEEKQRVRDVVAAITDHLIDHDFTLIDHDGKPTRWGRFSPHDLHVGDMIHQRPLNTLSILSYLKVAEHVTGDPKYTEAYRSLINDHGYKASILISKTQAGPGTGNQSDDEMAFMNYYTVLSYETDPELRRLFTISMYRYWINERPELNPLFNFIFASRFEGFGRSRTHVPQEVLEESVDTLKRYPLDRIRYAFDHTHRTDVVLKPNSLLPWRHSRGHRFNGNVIPIDERSVEHWNHDPWNLKEGGSGHSLTDGAAFLLPYYMGLYHGFIIEKDD
ncbi:MAG: hypothetical protein R3C02_06550 [Planctomycetaceae bacterium]